MLKIIIKSFTELLALDHVTKIEKLWEEERKQKGLNLIFLQLLQQDFFLFDFLLI